MRTALPVFRQGCLLYYLFKHNAERLADGWRSAGRGRARPGLSECIQQRGHFVPFASVTATRQAGEVRRRCSTTAPSAGAVFVGADVGDDEDLRQVDRLDGVQRSLGRVVVACEQRDVRFEALADALVGAGGLQNAVDVASGRGTRCPMRPCRLSGRA